MEQVNHPKHYNMGKYEVIDVIEDWKLGFNLGNAIKYIARCEHKENKIQDLEKAAFYISREIAYTKEKNGIENDNAQMYLEDTTPKYIKKTMIISEYNLAMIIGIANSKKTQIKDVLNQLLDYAIANLDEETLTEAQKSIGVNETTKGIKLF